MSEKKKVSELNPSSSTNDDDLIMVVQENSNNELENFKQTRANFMANYYGKNDTYSKAEIDTKLVAIYKYRGTVASYSNLPSTSLTVGDVYNVEDTGDNYAWTGTEWDKLGGTIDVSGFQTKSNLVTSVSSSSTDTQYPSAKCVYDLVGDIESALQTLNTGGGVE